MGSLLLSAFSTTLLGNEPGSVGAKSINVSKPSQICSYFFFKTDAQDGFLGCP